MQFSPYVPVVLRRSKFRPEILTPPPPSEGVTQGRDGMGKRAIFEIERHYLENGRRNVQSYH